MEFVFFGNVVVWALISLVVFLVIAAQVESESALWATGTVAVVLLGLEFLTDLHPLSFVYRHPVYALFWAAMYVLAGVVWGGIKWVSFTYNTRDSYAAFRATYMSNGGLTEDNLSNQDRREIVNDFKRRYKISLPLLISDHLERITLWMTFWPVSLATTILNDPVRRLFAWIVRGLSSMLQSISGRAFAAYSKDFIR